MKQRTFRQELTEVLRSFDEGEIDEAKLANYLVDFSPGLWPPAETWDIFRLRAERWTGEKFMTARERGLTLREMQRGYIAGLHVATRK